mmetsp:Transcript_6153/g.9789  ORF Transcript_6153/g.9789 Transcript_6153/m.9789 type:complete len:642 (-) Transcript_6153:857-2782(-)|eukprot:CAMPEP_0194240076 /NCGR_PEP_ID=MMETSP0158-20130606/6365_1 /TAXON_ID=33649 /ORGANISM="Thalassionema nitzschioides, Strain L26-B" /LENGTH=641 /DNA_ID=CAMNT_0038974713 /DNA_START=29 /DNA_END=1954 /DNA_ORIENTATION=+
MATPEGENALNDITNGENNEASVVVVEDNTKNNPTTEVTTNTMESDDVSTISVQSSVKSLKDTINIVPDDEKIGKDDIMKTNTEGEVVTNPIQEIQRRLDQTVKEQHENLKKGLGKLQESTHHVVRQIQTSTGETFQKLQKNTSKLGDSAKERSYRTFEQVGSSTRNLMEEHVQPSFQRSVQAVQGHSQRVLVQTSESLKTRVAPKVDEFHQTHVSPKLGLLSRFHQTYSPYYMGTAPGVVALLDHHPYLAVLKTTLWSCSQVLYCESPVTGALVLLSIAILAPWVALTGLSSLLTSTFAACSLTVSPKDGDNNNNNDSTKNMAEAGANAFLVGTVTATMWVDATSTSAVVFFLTRLLPATFFLGPLCWYVHQQIATYTNIPLLWSSNVVLVVVGLLSSLMTTTTPAVVAADEGSSFVLIGSLTSIFGLAASEWTGWTMLLGVTLCAPILSAALIAVTVVQVLIPWLILSSPSTSTIVLYQAGLTTIALVYHFRINKTLMVVGSLAVLWTCTLQVALDALLMKVIGIPCSSSFTLAFCVATMPLLVASDENKPSLLGLEPRDREEEPVYYHVVADTKAADDAVPDAEDVEKNGKEVVLDEDTTSWGEGSSYVAVEKAEAAVVVTEATPLIGTSMETDAVDM